MPHKVVSLLLTASLASATTRPADYPPLQYLGASQTYRAKNLPAVGTVTGFAIEGGGSRSLYLGLAVERAQRLLAYAERTKILSSEELPALTKNFKDGSFLDESAVEAFSPSRTPDLVSGSSGGTWAMHAITYSPTAMRRLGKYVDAEFDDQFTFDYLTALDEGETLSWMQDKQLNTTAFFVGSMPDMSSATSLLQWALTSLQRTLPVGLESLQPIDPHHVQWSYLVSYIMAFAGVDARSALSWDEKGGSAASSNTTTPHAPTLVSSQRRFAPYPIALVADQNPSKFASILAKNSRYATISYAWPATEWTPAYVHQDSMYGQEDGRDWAVAATADFVQTSEAPQLSDLLFERLKGDGLVGGKTIPEDAKEWASPIIGEDEDGEEKRTATILDAGCRSSYFVGAGAAVMLGNAAVPLLVEPVDQTSAVFDAFLKNRELVVNIHKPVRRWLDSMLRWWNGEATEAGKSALSKIFSVGSRLMGFRDWPSSQGGAQAVSSVPQSVPQDSDSAFGIDSADSGLSEMTAVSTLVRNGATRIIFPTAKNLDYETVQKVANWSDEEWEKKVQSRLSMAEFYSEYYKQPASGDWTKLLSGRMSTELEWAKLFGLTMNGTDDGRQIFDPIGLRDVFRAFANKPSGFDNGAVATVVVRTVRNARRGIEGGKKVVLTIASLNPRANWVNAVNQKLRPANTTAQEICSGSQNRGGPFTLQNIFDFISLPCNRLMTNMFSWTVLRNAQDFALDYVPVGKFAADEEGRDGSCRDGGNAWKCVRPDDGQPSREGVGYVDEVKRTVSRWWHGLWGH